ncbi:MAG: alpha/beta fold hydrolase [Proteobacteria bacterium]|nr:alpha/beta fold hydrolase [Pseudomonadota bacterium]
MPTLDRNGVKIHYEVYGSGPALLLSHGYSATTKMWQGQIEALAKRHTLILWDMRGHGESDSPENVSQYGEPQTVADMAALLDVVGAKQAIIGGLSLGGYMSLAFHLKHPERTRALLIIDTGPGYKNDASREEWNKTAVARAEKLEREGLASAQGGSAERATARHHSAKGLALAARYMLTQRDAGVINSLPEIKVPSLVVVGANDAPFLKAADYMAAKIPGAEKAVIENAGHAANIDQPAAFNAVVLKFLDSLTSSH